MYDQCPVCGLSVHLIALLFALASTSALAAEEGPAHAAHEALGIAPIANQPPARIIVGEPLPEQLSRGLVVLPYRAENLRIVPVYGAASLDVNPRIGHIHVTVDDAAWHWADASNEPLIIQGLTPGRHKILIELANPVHLVIDRQTIELEIPAKPAQ